MTRNFKYNKRKKQPKWEREEVVLLVSEYFRTKSLSTSAQENSVEMLSTLLRKRGEILNMLIDERFRNRVGIRMKFGNIKSLDPEMLELGYVGLPNTSKLEREIVNEYLAYPDKIINDANIMFRKYGGCRIGE